MDVNSSVLAISIRTRPKFRENDAFQSSKSMPFVKNDEAILEAGQTDLDGVFVCKDFTEIDW